MEDNIFPFEPIEFGDPKVIEQIHEEATLPLGEKHGSLETEVETDSPTFK